MFGFFFAGRVTQFHPVVPTVVPSSGSEGLPQLQQEQKKDDLPEIDIAV